MAKRRDMLKLLPMAFLAGNGHAEAAKLPNAVIDPRNAKLTRDSYGEVRVYFEGSTDDVKSMTAGSLLLKPGMSPHPPHQHEEEELLVVIEGTGEITINDGRTPVGPGSMMYCAAGRVHGIQNTGKVPLLLYYSKWKA
jgi:mannose-6-phosphate isomerase-like protein (cupin superfamily)